MSNQNMFLCRNKNEDNVHNVKIKSAPDIVVPINGDNRKLIG